MFVPNPLRRALSLGLLLAMAACRPGNPEPAVASSAEQIGYSERHPAELQAASSRLEENHRFAAAQTEDLSKFVDELSEPDWELVERVYREADAEGRGGAFAERYEEGVVVQRFFEQEKKPVVSRVAGGAQRAAADKSCNVELYGPVSYSLERALDKQLEERRRADSNAHFLIEQNEQALGKKNVEPLQRHADRIALASHIVNVRQHLDRRAVTERLDEARNVRSTLESRREDLAKSPKPDREAITRVETALTTLDSATAQSEAALKDSDQRQRELANAYDAAFSSLLDAVKKRAKQSK